MLTLPEDETWILLWNIHKRLEGEEGKISIKKLNSKLSNLTPRSIYILFMKRLINKVELIQPWENKRVSKMNVGETSVSKSKKWLIF